MVNHAPMCPYQKVQVVKPTVVDGYEFRPEDFAQWSYDYDVSTIDWEEEF